MEKHNQILFSIYWGMAYVVWSISSLTMILIFSHPTLRGLIFIYQGVFCFIPIILYLLLERKETEKGGKK
jgi:hypothetical protein